MHKKLYILLGVMAALAGLLFFIQIKKTTEITVKKNPVALIAATALPIPESDTDFIFGNPGSAITVVEFIDLSCKECIQIHNEIKAVVAANPQAIRLIWKDFPQPKLISRDTTLAHQAAWCAGQQDSKLFWQFIDIASQHSTDLSDDGLKNIGTGLNLSEQWWSCTQSPAAKQKITDSVAIANSLRLESIPAIFINNKRINTKADINLTEMLQSFIKK